uniref:Caspase-9 like protein n=1 Tax=Onchidium reevesii TaxID=2547651 RepID=A0A7D7KW58_9EUPU|nr:caspase-9 like protein [Onchidium reevesii]
MEPRDRELIQKNYMSLVEIIKPRVDEVCGELLGMGIISSGMKEDITEVPFPSERKAMMLLDLLMTRGNHAVEALYKAGLQQQLYGLADILRPENQPHGLIHTTGLQDSTPTASAADDSPDEPLPDTWPDQAAIESIGTLRKVDKKQSRMLKLYKESLEVPGKGMIYRMKHRERGRCVVFNNYTFDHLQPRDGSNQDRKGVEKLFQALGFDVEVYNNKTCKKMWELMEEEAKADHSQADCFVMFIFSHGHSGVVFGTDGKKDEKEVLQNAIGIKRIRELFGNLDSLGGKPKLFFIQACQGDLKDKGQEVHDGGTSPMKASTSPDLPETTLSLQQQKRLNEENIKDIKLTAKNLEEDQSDAMGEKRPNQGDIFIAMATIPDHLSWRNTVHGSWFIQAVVYVFGKYAHKHNLDRLMNMVKNLVAKSETRIKQYKQIGEIISTLNKDFYFFPGLCEKEPNC